MKMNRHPHHITPHHPLNDIGQDIKTIFKLEQQLIKIKQPQQLITFTKIRRKPLKLVGNQNFIAFLISIRLRPALVTQTTELQTAVSRLTSLLWKRRIPCFHKKRHCNLLLINFQFLL